MKDWKKALILTLPVMFGYVFLGMAYGILMARSGYGVLWSFAASTLVFAGSMQFLMVELLTGGAGLGLTAAMTLLLNSRHLFYGLSFIEKFRALGRERNYMIFSLTDETYSVLCSLTDEESTPSLMVKVALLDQCWWVSGSVMGGIIGTHLPFDTTGIDFSMTALFVVIFIEQWLGAKSRLPAVMGLISSVVFLLLLGPDKFILPSLIVTVALLLGAKHTIETKVGGAV